MTGPGVLLPHPLKTEEFAMKIYFYLAVALCCLSFFAPNVSWSSECTQITTWSEEDALFNEWLDGLDGSVKVCNTPPCSRQVLPASMRPLHDWTSFYAVYPIDAAWGIWLGISSFENNFVAQAEFDKWADEYCPSGFNNPVREPSACAIFAGPRFEYDKSTSQWELSDCKSLTATAVYRGSIIAMGPYYFGEPPYAIPDSCDDQLTHYDELSEFAQTLIDNKCGCGEGKTPIPIEFQIFNPEKKAEPTIGIIPETINPLGLGPAAEGKDNPRFRLSLCKFEGPVDIYVAYMNVMSSTLYFLNGADKAVDIFSSEGFVAWRRGVVEPVDALLPSDFGGLFQGGRLPKGVHSFYVMVTPAGMLEHYYIWSNTVSVSCLDPDNDSPQHIPMPSGQSFYLYDPVAVPVTGTNPKAIRPLAAGPAALGSGIPAFSADFCCFEGQGVDLYFGAYCIDDPLNIYYLNDTSGLTSELTGSSGGSSSAVEIWTPVAISGGFELPDSPTIDNVSFDCIQESGMVFFNSALAASLGLSVPEPEAMLCYYLLVATPPGDRSNFYAWLTPLDWNIKAATTPFFQTMQQEPPTENH